MRVRRPKPIEEWQARGEIARVYHEIKQVLRVTGVNLNFRTWAAYGNFLPLAWEAVRDSAQTSAFEQAADEIRAEAVRAAAGLGRLDAHRELTLGESQRFHIRGILDLYHYINPKLLLLTSSVRLALAGETVGRDDAGQEVETIERGAPPAMHAMEMEAERPRDPRLRSLFSNIKRTTSSRSVNSDYRSLALWPDYLEAAWERLRPILGSQDYRTSGEALRSRARELCGSLPAPVVLSLEQVSAAGVELADIREVTASFEHLLPPLILNIALMELDWRAPEELARSPFPAPRRGLESGARHAVA